MSRELFNRAGIVGATRVFALAAQTLTSILVARALGPEDYGILAFALTLVNLAAMPAVSGVGTLVVREVARFQAGRAVAGDLRAMLSTVGTWISFASLAMIFLLVVFSVLLIDETRRNETILLAALFVPLLSLMPFYSAILQGQGLAVRSQFAEWLLAPFSYLLLVVVLWAADGLTRLTAIGSGLAASGAALLFLYRQARASLGVLPALLSGNINGRWFRVLRPFALLQAAILVNNHVPVLVLGVAADDHAVGIFRVAESIASLAALSLVVVNLVVAPRIVALHADQDRCGLQRLAQGSIRLAFVASASLSAVLVLVGEPLIDRVFGAAYHESYRVLLVLLAGQLINVGCGSVGMLLNMTGHERDYLHALGIAVVLNTLLCAVLAPFFHAIGAAIGAAASLATWNLWLTGRVRKRLGIHPAIL